MRSRAWVSLDCSMLIIVIVLEAWRLTGVVLHEWLAIALIGGLLVHLGLHWPWVESRSRRILGPRSGRARVNYGLNLTLFCAMAAAMVSGFMISKVAWPAHPSAAEYMKWHSIHDLSSRVVLVCLGLHLGLNWDLLTAAIRNALRARTTKPRSVSKPLTLRALIMPTVSIAAALAIVGGGLWTIERFIPSPTVTFIKPDGTRVDNVPPPPDIARLRPDEVSPTTQGIPAFVMQGIVVAVVSVIGRKVLRLRLE